MISVPAALITQLDCIMFTKGTKPFCKVYEAAVVRTIRYNAD
jgi:hypothetical protein